MKRLNLLAALLLMMAGLQTADAQGFRVYKSDGTIAQFSLRTDSIVFYDGIGTDVDFGPFTPVNQCIVGTWYKTKSETVTFNEDGTTDYMEGATYKFFPYQGTIIIYNASGLPTSILKVHELTEGQMVVTPEGRTFRIWSTTEPPQFVTGIMLSETAISLLPGETKTLTAAVLPADADNPAVTWSSSNETVAKVLADGYDAVVLAKAGGACVITCSATDGSGVKAECQVSVGSHDWVDLGLPSGTLWATCNVGADRPEDYGDYFAWGETAPKETYDYTNYFDSEDETGTKFIKYNGTSGLTELLPEDDAATVNWGSGWQMPSYEQFLELINSSNTTTEWTTQNGVNGRTITSISNGNSIFLPAAGYRLLTGLENAKSVGVYWSRSLETTSFYSNFAYYLGFEAIPIDCFVQDRAYGMPVRPVRVK